MSHTCFLLFKIHSQTRVEEQVDLARVTVGAQYSHTECKLELMCDQISLQYTLKTDESTTKGHHPIALDEIEVFHYYISKKRGIVLAIMRVSPTKSNGLDKISNYLRFLNSRNDLLRRQKGYIVLELRSRENLQRLLEWMKENDSLRPFTDDNKNLSFEDCTKYAETMLEKIALEKKERESSLSSPRKRRSRGSKAKTSSDSNEVMLVFPFGADEEKIDAAAENLTEANLVLEQVSDGAKEMISPKVKRPAAGSNRKSPISWAFDRDASEIETDNAPIEEAATTDEAKTKARAHYLTIRQEDFDRLEPGEFLNDTLIDFWMQWYVS
jgi:Ulp1 family protease